MVIYFLLVIEFVNEFKWESGWVFIVYTRKERDTERVSVSEAFRECLKFKKHVLNYDGI